jgi:hypothetical protein
VSAWNTEVNILGCTDLAPPGPGRNRAPPCGQLSGSCGVQITTVCATASQGRHWGAAATCMPARSFSATRAAAPCEATGVCGGAGGAPHRPL